MKLYNFLITVSLYYIGKILKKKFAKPNYNIITFSNYNKKNFANLFQHLKYYTMISIWHL